MWPRGKALYNQVEHKPAETGVTRQQGTTAEQIGEPAPTNGAGVTGQQGTTAKQIGEPAPTNGAGVTGQQGTTAEQIGEPAPTNGAGCGDGIHLAVSLNPDAKTGASIPVPAQVLLDHDHMS